MNLLESDCLLPLSVSDASAFAIILSVLSNNSTNISSDLMKKSTSLVKSEVVEISDRLSESSEESSASYFCINRPQFD